MAAVGYVGSRPISEVKQPTAALVLIWVTDREIAGPLTTGQVRQSVCYRYHVNL